MSAVAAPVLAGGAAIAGAVLAGVAVSGWPSSAPRRPPVGGAHARQRQRHHADRLTITVLTALGRPLPDAAARRHLRRWSALVLLALIGAPSAALPVAGAGWALARRRHHRGGQDRQRAVARSLPDAVDLLALCTRAGVALPLAHDLVAHRLAAPIGPALAAAQAEAAAGRSRADALVDALVPLGDRAATLAHVLAEHLRYGVPLAPALERLGAEVRAARRRQAEEDARKVPVRLLAPLVACVLPAFALLTVVPLLAASLRALPT